MEALKSETEDEDLGITILPPLPETAKEIVTEVTPEVTPMNEDDRLKTRICELEEKLVGLSMNLPKKKVTSEKQRANLEKARLVRKENLGKRKIIKEKIKEDKITERKLVNNMLQDFDKPPSEPVLEKVAEDIVKPVAVPVTLPIDIPIPQQEPMFTFVKIRRRPR